MAGYSVTPLWKKLGMKPDQHWILISVPDRFEIENAPCNTKRSKSVPKNFDGLLLFAQSRKSLDASMKKAVANMHAEASVWIAWPKKSSQLESDLDFDYVQQSGLSARLVDNKVCAIDEDWSALRFVVRKIDRPSWRQ